MTVTATTGLSRRLAGSTRAQWLQVMVGCWLVAAAFTSAAANAQSSADAAIVVEWTASPTAPAPGAAFTLAGEVAIDPNRADGASAGTGAIAWALVVGPLSNVDLANATCGVAAGTSCAAEVGDANSTARFSGVIEDSSATDVSVAVEIRGSVADDADVGVIAGETCGTVRVVPSTPPTSRLPARMATPDASCGGARDMIEVAVGTAVPSSTAVLTATPEPTATVTPSPIPTSEPSPTATSEPTVTATPEPSATATATAASTATVEPTATTAPTEEPTVTSSPASTPTVEPPATVAPTATFDSTATVEPTPAPTATVSPTGAAGQATAPPQPVPDEDNDSSSTGLWVGVGTLLVLATAAGIVLYQRRKLTA